MTENKTVLKRVTDDVQTGKFEINKDVGLAKIKTIVVSASKDGLQKYGKKAFSVNVSVQHPVFGDMPFSFAYMPSDGNSTDFKNSAGHTICMGQLPHGDMKDIIIAAVSHESYAYQLSLEKTAWLHAERGPENGEYLLWHYMYYGVYSPRSIWKLPAKCEKEKLWQQDPCNSCIGIKCEKLKSKCSICGGVTNKICPACKLSTCFKHSHCKNGHYNLTDEGMFEGTCESCGRKMPMGELVCKTCGHKGIRRF